MNELALFAGAGGGILAGKLLGWRTVCAVEWEPYAACVLAARQNDGLLPPFPIWDDVQTFDGRPWAGVVDVVSGGFPCQDISVAGKGAGITGERSGMWRHMARIIGEVRPRYVFVENSPALITRGLGVVLGDLAALGYDCKWTVLGAADVGAPHQRDRFWLVAHANSLRELQPQGSISDQWRRVGDCCAEMADADGADSQGGGGFYDTQGWEESFRHARLGSGVPDWYASEPDVGRVANGVDARVDRLKALGNGQVPACAAAAWRLLINASQSGQTF
jgi:DNA (cytosine-5)-methyltransferase 1